MIAAKAPSGWAFSSDATGLLPEWTGHEIKAALGMPEAKKGCIGLKPAVSYKLHEGELWAECAQFN